MRSAAGGCGTGCDGVGSGCGSGAGPGPGLGCGDVGPVGGIVIRQHLARCAAVTSDVRFRFATPTAANSAPDSATALRGEHGGSVEITGQDQTRRHGDTENAPETRPAAACGGARPGRAGGRSRLRSIPPRLRVSVLILCRALRQLRTSAPVSSALSARIAPAEEVAISRRLRAQVLVRRFHACAKVRRGMPRPPRVVAGSRERAR